VVIYADAVEPNKKRTAARAILIGLVVFCFGLVVLAFEELVFVHLCADGVEQSRSLLRTFCISFAAMVVLGVGGIILTRRRDLWSCLVDTNESIGLSLALPAISGRRFAESRGFTILVCILFGLFVLATVATVVAYLYSKGT